MAENKAVCGWGWGWGGGLVSAFSTYGLCLAGYKSIARASHILPHPRAARGAEKIRGYEEACHPMSDRPPHDNNYSLVPLRHYHNVQDKQKTFSNLLYNELIMLFEFTPVIMFLQCIS